MKSLYTTGEVAKILGISRDTVRYYDKKEIVKSKKNENGYRVYSREDVIAFYYVLNLKQLNMSLEEIYFMLNESSLENSIRVIKNQEDLIKKEIEETLNRMGIVRDHRAGLEFAQKYHNKIFIEDNTMVVYKKIRDDNIYEIFNECEVAFPHHKHMLSFFIGKDLFLSNNLKNFNKERINFEHIISMLPNKIETEENKFEEKGFSLFNPQRCIHTVIDTYVNEDYSNLLKLRDYIIRHKFKVTSDILWRAISLRNIPNRLHDYNEIWIAIE